MADNDMILSQEVAEPAGDDDIDIDIDISSPHNDEDYILEDVQSNHSHEIGNDDLMIDDENPSFPMDDIVVDQEETDENLHVEDADLVEMRDYETAHGVVDISGEDLTLFAEGLEETLEEENHILNVPQDAEGPEDPSEKANDVAADLFGQTEARNTINSPPKFPLEADAETRQVPDLHDHSPQEHSSVKSRIIQDGKDYKEASTDSQPSAVGDEDYNDTEDELDTMGGAMKPPIPAVIVTYQDVEYSLVATSESDDPDTYFLQDGALTTAPLADFFAALKDVVQEDLTADDELCLRFDDLGLEISETCMSVHETTFNSLMQLRESLLHNDGVVTPAPVRVFLGTKPDFAKRLVLLLAGAAEGKGLSEFVTYDEESENHEDASDDTHPVENDISPKGNVEEDQYPNRALEAGGNESSNNLLARDHLLDDEASEHTTARELNAVAQEDTSSEAPGIKFEVEYGKSAPSSGSLAEQDMSRGKAVTITARQTDHVNHSISDVDEDGDLIDYSDDEYPEKQEALGSANVKKQTDKSSTHASDETRDQRSISDAADKAIRLSSSLDEVAYSESFVDHSTATQNGHGRSNIYKVENEDGEQDVLSYEQHVDEDYQVGQAPEPEEGSATTDFDENQALFHGVEQEYEEVESGPVSLENGKAQKITDRGNLKNDRTHVVNDEDLEIDYELRDNDLEPVQSSPAPILNLGIENLSAAIDDESQGVEDEINYEDDDTRELNQSDETLVADKPLYHYDDDGNVHALEDELSYETDDHQDLSHPPESKVLDEPSRHPIRKTGKRQRMDAEDPIQHGSKQSKRARP